MPTNILRGDAVDQSKIYTLTPANPEPGDTFRIVINGKAVSYQAETGDTAGDVVDGLVGAVSASTIPEFIELTAEAADDGLSLTLSGPAGVEVLIETDTIDAGGFTIVVTTVTAGDPGVNEIQRVSIPSSTSGGTFTLTFAGQTTAAIAYNAAAATVQTALEALSNIAAGDVIVGGASPTWTVEFDSTYANTNVPLLTGSGASLTGAASITHATTVQGKPGTNEIKTLTQTQFDATGSAFNEISFGGDQATDIHDEITAGTLQTRLEGMRSIGTGNVLVSRSGSSGNYTWTIEFIGDLGHQDVGTMSLLPNTGSGGGVEIPTTQEGSATATDEIQTIRVNGAPTGGDFTVTFQGQTTAAIAFDASAATLEAALELLSNIDDVTVTKSGTTYTVTFGGVNAGTDLQQMTSSAAGLTGGAVTGVTTQEATTAANEVQQIAFSQDPGGGTFTLTFDAETTGAIAYNASAATVQTALEGLATPVAGDFSVTGPDGGPWLVEFQQNYAATDVSLITGDGANLTGGGSQSLAVTVTQVFLGASCWNDPANWTLAQVPETGDDVILEQGSANLRYGLRQIDDFTADAGTDVCTTVTEHHFVEDQKVRVRNSGGALPAGLAAATDYYVLNATTNTFQLSETRGEAAVDITGAGTGTHTIAVELQSLMQLGRFTGEIGLPLRNTGGYYEYRERELTIGLLSTGSKKLKLGLGEGQGSGLMRFDFDDYQIDGLIRETSGGTETQVPAVLIKNTHSSSEWLIESGEAGFAFHAGETSTIGTLTQRGGSVILGDGVTISTALIRTAGELLSIGEVTIAGTIEISG